jgi:hypothetical protein
MAHDVAGAANRLRMVQVDCADQSDEIRRQCLEAELDALLKKLPTTERRQFLERLMNEFPAWEAAGEASPVVQSEFDIHQLDDPDFLVARLAKLAPSLDEQKKQLIATELNRVGMSMVGTPAWSKQAADEFRQLLGMTANETIEFNRVLELLTLLMKMGLNAEQVAWTTWRDLERHLEGGASAVKQPSALKPMLRKCSTGDANTPRTLVALSTERLQQLLANIIRVIPFCGQFAYSQFNSLSPEALTKLDEMEGGGWFGRPARLWDRYEKAYAELSAQAFDIEVRKKFAEQIRKWM